MRAGDVIVGTATLVEEPREPVTLQAARSLVRHLDREFGRRITPVAVSSRRASSFAWFDPPRIVIATRTAWRLEDAVAHEYAHTLAGAEPGRGSRFVIHGERFYRSLLTCIKAQGRDVRSYEWAREYRTLTSRARRDGWLT